MIRKSDYSKLESLFEEAISGNEIAFAQIYAATVEPLYYLAYHVLQDQPLAQGVIQETYIIFFNNMQQIENAQAILPYLNRVTYLLCLKVINKEQDKSKTSDSKQQSSSPLSNEPAADISLALKKLSYHLRAALILRYESNLSLNNIAFIMEVSPRMAKRYIQTALGELKASLPNTF